MTTYFNKIVKEFNKIGVNKIMFNILFRRDWKVTKSLALNLQSKIESANVFIREL